MTQPSDEDLIRGTLTGDQAAFAELVRRHQRRVAVTIRSVIGDLSQDDLADIAQDVFLLVFRSLGSFRGDSQFGTYLTRITLRHCYRESKRRRRRSSTFFSFNSGADDRPPDERFDSGARTDRAVVAQERKGEVARALTQLPEEFRMVLVLRIIEEMSVEEVAETLSISTGTVKSRLFRAKERMRELLAGCDLEFQLDIAD